ncbi:MAG: D-alanyl-D-alanine carboxypeptidase [Parvibaculaceae bacterium]
MLTAFVALTVLPSASEALAAPRFAAIAVDAHSGKVLYSRDADGVCHPASLTKVMTLYVLFQEMSAGRLSRDTRLNVSNYASSREPSKLGLKPGQTIRVDDAIRAIVTKSANDAATAVAEGISGSESAFAARMTRTARAMGMTRTTFLNASGLPNPGQVTSARDMATLGLRIQRDFPQYYGYFALRSFVWNGKKMQNHNRLLGRFKGMDGIKTGYIRASGFNLVTSAERDGKRLVGVVMGGRSSAARNQYMASMLETQFDKATFAKSGTIAAAAGDPPGYSRSNQIADDTTRRTRTKLAEVTNDSGEEIAQTKQQIAKLKAVIEAAESKAVAERDKSSQQADVGKLAAEKLRTTRLQAQKQLAAKYTVEKAPQKNVTATAQTAADEANSSTAATSDDAAAQLAEATMVPSLTGKSRQGLGQTFASVIVSEAEAAPVDSSDAGIQKSAKGDNLAALVSEPEPTKPATGNWSIQVGAFPSKGAAERRIEEARAFGLNALDNKTPFTMSVQINGETMFRARFSGFTESAARSACKSLAAKGMSCLPLSPQG